VASVRDLVAAAWASGVAGLLGWIAWPLAAPLAASSRWAAALLFLGWRAAAGVVESVARLVAERGTRVPGLPFPQRAKSAEP